MEMHHADMRNKILADIIDKMHQRMADKMYPSDQHGDMAAASAEGSPMPYAEGGLVPEAPLSAEPGQAQKGDRLPDYTCPPESGKPKMDDDEAPTENDEDAMLLEELMKQHG